MWAIYSFLLALAGLPVTLLGLVLVPIGLMFKRVMSGRVPFTQYPGEWELVRLPKWLLPWDNTFDGFLGDKRGWWSNECEKNGYSCRSLKAMWLWGAVRNPANYWSRVMTGIDVSKCVVHKVAGNCDLPSEKPGAKEWVHLVAHHENGRDYHRFFMSWSISTSHAVMIDIGWKVKLAHNGMSPDADIKDRIRGSVFTMSPWKKT